MHIIVSASRPPPTLHRPERRPHEFLLGPRELPWGPQGGAKRDRTHQRLCRRGALCGAPFGWFWSFGVVLRSSPGGAHVDISMVLVVFGSDMCFNWILCFFHVIVVSKIYNTESFPVVILGCQHFDISLVLKLVVRWMHSPQRCFLIISLMCLEQILNV